MIELLWPFVALVAVVLAFQVAWRHATRTGVEHATKADLKGEATAMGARLARYEEYVGKLRERTEALEELTKKLDARTSNDPALARLPAGLRRGGP
jgi:hypothetical protein